MNAEERAPRWLPWAVSLGLVAVTAAGGCRRPAPPPPPAAAPPAATPPAAGEKGGQAGAKGEAGAKGAAKAGDKKPGGKESPFPAKPGAKTPAGAKPDAGAAAGTGGTAAAPAAGTTAPAGGAPVPPGGTAAPAGGSATIAPATDGAGLAPSARKVARGPDDIPGVPKIEIPAAKHNPFRSDATGKKRGSTVDLKGSVPNPIRPKGLGGFDNIWIKPLPVPGGDRRQGTGGSTGQPPAAANGGTGTAPVPAAPPLQLTGVIEGQPLMAILQGESSHYIVQEGDRVPGGFQVASISLQQVVLRGPDMGTVTLRLGGKRG